jgi:hypothetical protein
LQHSVAQYSRVERERKMKEEEEEEEEEEEQLFPCRT